MCKQLPLSISLRVDATFDNFYVSASNAVAVDALKHFCDVSNEHFFYVWGKGGSGVSHLLQAVQHRAADLNIQYLPLAELLSPAEAYTPDDVFSGLEVLDLVVIDDLQKIVGLDNWQLGLFHLYNRLRDAGKRLLIGANGSPRELDLNLADLQSRLQWGISYQFHALNDDEKKQAVLDRAEAMGMRLGDEVMQFILNHCSRDLRRLMDVLNTIDKASLAEKRHLTIPFVKRVLGF
ncbi:MAG: DnaA family protein [Kiritimatiellia bacterium]|jgi:DnaA family protein